MGIKYDLQNRKAFHIIQLASIRSHEEALTVGISVISTREKKYVADP